MLFVGLKGVWVDGFRRLDGIVKTDFYLPSLC